MPDEASHRPGRRARLSREAVLRAAVALADERGIEGLTMRNVGSQLGAEAMSLYRHVANKEDLLDGMIDIVFGEIALPAGDDWKTTMRKRAVSAREVLLRHPWALGLMESRTSPGQATLRHHDAVLGVLFDAGFTSATGTHAYNLLDSYVYGFALQESSLPFQGPDELAEVGEMLLQQIPADQFPHLARSARELLDSGFDYAAEFEFGLDLILDALEGRFAAGLHN